MSTLKSISDQDFETEVLKSSEPVLVDFWAPWCGPCKALTPKLEEISTNYEGKVKFCKMNVDDNPATPAKFGVRGIPTVVVIKDGEMVDQFVGNQPNDVIEKLLNKFV